MKQKKYTKRALCMSLLSMLLCVSMLVGTTFAWFTDSVTSGKNQIVAGNLDVELEYAKAMPAGDGTMKLGEWQKVTEGTTDLFQPVDGGESLWEPGHTEVVYLRVRNAGTLALKYKLSVTGKDNMTRPRLSDYLVFGQAISDTEPVPYASRTAAQEAAGSTKKLSDYNLASTLLPSEDEYVALVVYMPEDVGNEANIKGGTAPAIDLSINLTATQMPYEPDSFDENYDKDAQPDDGEIMAGEISAVVPTEGEAEFDFGDGAVHVAVPVEDIPSGTEKITLSVKETSLPSGIACDEDNGDGSKSYTISVTPLMAELPSPITVRVYIGDWYQTADAYINRVEVGDHVTQEHAAGIGLMSADDAAEDVTFKDGYVTFSTKAVGTFSIVGHGFKYTKLPYEPYGVAITGLGNIDVGEDGVLTIPDTIAGEPVTKIEQMAFFGSNEKFAKITEVHLGQHVAMIDNSAFRGLTNLEKINIPASVYVISQNVFADCNNLSYAEFGAVDNWVVTGSIYGSGFWVPAGGTPVDSAMLSDPAQAGPYLHGRNTNYMIRYPR